MNYNDEGHGEYPCISERANTKATKHIAVDIIACRRNAPYRATELPVFTPMDDVEPIRTESPLPDLVYVDKPLIAHNLDDLLDKLPFHGRGWYHKCAIEYCLRVAGEDVRRVIDRMGAVWVGVEFIRTGADEGQKTRKRAIIPWWVFGE